jgi:type I restriction enzyme S subunit
MSKVEWKKIEDLGSFFGGLSGKTKDDFVDGNAKFVTYKNVFANPSLDINTTGEVKINKGEKQNKIQKGDILFTGSSEIPEEAGMSCVVTENLKGDYYMNSFCFGVRLNNPDNYCLDYLKHVLRSSNIRKEIAKSASGVTRFNISKARFGKVLIPCPSLSEQEKLADQLDTFTSSIENLKEQIAQRRKQYEHYRDQLLDLEGKDGVEMKAIGELFVFKNGLNKEKKYFGQGNPIVNYTDVYHNNRLSHEVLQGRVTLTENEIERFEVKKGDVFFTRTSETPDEIGFAAVLLDDVKKCTFSGFLLRARPITKLLVPEYCAYCFSSYKVRQAIIKYSTFTTRALTNGTSLSKITIPVPTLSEQCRIVDILSTFEASIQNLEAQLSLREKQYEYYRNKLLTFE